MFVTDSCPPSQVSICCPISFVAGVGSELYTELFADSDLAGGKSEF
jgi:hypothetical protein